MSLDINLNSDVKILDFGCGNGKTVNQLLDSGFDAQGCDLKFKQGRYVNDLVDRNRIHKITSLEPYRLPYEDNTFDLIISQQVLEHINNYVEVVEEMRRVLKPDGFTLHMFPSRYRPIESHVYVPFSSVIRNYWYLWVWAILGIRKIDQKGMTPAEVAMDNQRRLNSSTNYLGGQEILNIFHSCGFKNVKYIENIFLQNSPNSRGRLLYKIGVTVPFIFLIYRVFWSRILLTS